MRLVSHIVFLKWVPHKELLLSKPQTGEGGVLLSSGGSDGLVEEATQAHKTS